MCLVEDVGVGGIDDSRERSQVQLQAIRELHISQLHVGCVAVLAASPLRQYLYFGTSKASKAGHNCQLHVGCVAVKWDAFASKVVSKVRHIFQ